MIYAHVYVDEKLLTKRPLPHCPRVGDTLRYGEPDRFAKVTEVIWCLNEDAASPEFGTRVNVRAVATD